MKKCTKCGEQKLLSAFPSRCGKDKWRDNKGSWCRKCKNKSRWQAQIKQKYGVSPEKYSEMFAMQNGCCAICGCNQPANGKKYFSVDHVHATGYVRGLLCDPCNQALGGFRDDIGRLQAAIKYLKINQPSAPQK